VNCDTFAAKLRHIVIFYLKASISLTGRERYEGRKACCIGFNWWV